MSDITTLAGAQAVTGQAIESNGTVAAEVQEAITTFSASAQALLAAKMWLDKYQAEMAEALGPNNETVGGLTSAAEQADTCVTALAAASLKLEETQQALGALGAELEDFQGKLEALA